MSLAQSQQKKIFVQPVNYCQNCTLVVRSVGIITRQSYDNINNEFFPDYSNPDSQLQIFPQCTLVNPDSPTASRVVNKELSEIVWLEVTSGGEEQICSIKAEASSTVNVKDGYSVTGTGEDKGELFVRCNGTVGVPRTLRFKAKWIDRQSGNCYNFIKDIRLSIDDATEPIPELVVDIPKSYQWNPFRNPSVYTATANVFVGKQNMVNDARCKLFWYSIDNSGVKKLISNETDVPTLEVSSLTKNENGQITAMQFNLDFISESSYEVVACFRSKGELPTEPNKNDPKYQFHISRSYPVMAVEFRGKNISVSQGTKSILLSAIVKDNMDVVPDWGRYAQAYWHRVRSWVDQNNVMQQERTILGVGEEIDIPTSEQNFIQLTLEDKGTYKPVLDGSSNYLVSDKGEFVVMNDIV